MMSRMLTCTNLIYVCHTLLKFNFNQFPGVTGSIKHITKRDKTDQVAFLCIPTDAPSGTLPVDVVWGWELLSKIIQPCIVWYRRISQRIEIIVSEESFVQSTEIPGR